MDTSDSEASEELENMSEGSDGEWVDSTRKTRKRQRILSNHSNPNLASQNKQENAEPKKTKDEKCISPSDVPSGCSCSKFVSCKTNKCKCRGSGAQCGAGCGCEDSKCSNRDASDSKEIIDQGIKLLEGAFSETEAQDAKSKKHLADIGNNAVSTVIYLAGVGANWCIHLQNCNQ